jgi:hypothetical protein
VPLAALGASSSASFWAVYCSIYSNARRSVMSEQNYGQWTAFGASSSASFWAVFRLHGTQGRGGGGGGGGKGGGMEFDGVCVGKRWSVYV